MRGLVPEGVKQERQKIAELGASIEKEYFLPSKSGVHSTDYSTHVPHRLWNADADSPQSPSW